MNLYGVLEVSPKAGPDEIRRAYRRLVLRVHPDTTGNTQSDRFRQVREAYEVLSDPVQRAEYDRTLESRIPVRVTSTRYPQSPVEPLMPPSPYRYTGNWRLVEELSFPEDPLADWLRWADFLLRRF